MPYDLSALDRVQQRFVRRGTSLFVETYNQDTNLILDSFEFTNAPLSLPNEVYEIARQRLTEIASPVAGNQTQIGAGAVGLVSARADNTLVFPDGSTSKLVLTTTFAALPAASAYIGQALVTDVGPSGSFWRSNGVSWGLVGGMALLAQGAGLSVDPGSTSEQDLVSILLPGGLMGTVGELEVVTMWEGTVNANTKTTKVKLGGTAFLNTTGLTSNASYLLPPTRIANFGAQNSQRSYPAANGNASTATGTSATTGAIDTSAPTTLAISGTKATGTDTLTLSYYSIRLYRP